MPRPDHGAPTRTATSSATATTTAGAAANCHADRADEAAAALGLRRLVLRVLRPHRGRLREHDRAARSAAEGVPLDVLVVDTDFKAPGHSGTAGRSTRPSSPTGVLRLGHAQGLHNTLNIHPSILGSDPKFAAGAGHRQGQAHDGATAARLLHLRLGRPGPAARPTSTCTPAWGRRASTSGGSTGAATPRAPRSPASPPTPGSTSSTPTARRAGGRGFAFSRAYGSLQPAATATRSACRPARGPTSAPPCTSPATPLRLGDAAVRGRLHRRASRRRPGWPRSATTSAATRRRDLQEPGAEPGSTKLPDDLYARWVQLGTFQPIDRLHSNHSDRLPWQYGAAAKASAEKFLNLREKLLPLHVPLAAEATRDRHRRSSAPLYLQYPERAGGVRHGRQRVPLRPRLAGRPGDHAGHDRDHDGVVPARQHLDRLLHRRDLRRAARPRTSRPPGHDAGVRQVRRHRADPAHNVDQRRPEPLDDVTLTVATGANGSFALYEDDGEDTRPAGPARPGPVDATTDGGRDEPGGGGSAPPPRCGTRSRPSGGQARHRPGRRLLRRPGAGTAAGPRPSPYTDRPTYGHRRRSCRLPSTGLDLRRRRAHPERCRSPSGP